MLFIGILVFPLIAQAIIYKSIDNQGNIHFSDVPSENSEEIELWPLSKERVLSGSKDRASNTKTAWFEGGDLYKKTAREWHASTEQNKLATSAGMVLAMTPKKYHDKLIAHDALILKVQSMRLTVCISEATNDPELFYLGYFP